jgi:hypothetical protein
MKKEAVRCNKCRSIIDLTVNHYMTIIEVWNTKSPDFLIGGNCKDITILRSKEHNEDNCWCDSK